MPIDPQETAKRFSKLYGQPPQWVVRAPGRVNLIGEHTDYNEGFVLPMAIDRAVWIALRPREDRRVVVHSVNYGQTGEFSLEHFAKEGSGWTEYFKAVAWALGEAGFPLSGWEGLVEGDVPVGAGLSSSAALELATARAFSAVGGLPWDPVAMARLGQRAENEWIGVRCGIMDQLVSAAGRAGHALLIDCRSLDFEPVP
ncbi:MAG: galactokinase, partial [Pirellulales bacterium]|nr:galactokinase [Pirellulales bacterium]